MVDETLPAPIWQWLERDRYCCMPDCGKELEAGTKALFFPHTHSVYCRKCSRLLTGKLASDKRRYKRGEYMPPVGG